jgi:hypothetical protein
MKIKLREGNGRRVMVLAIIACFVFWLFAPAELCVWVTKIKLDPILATGISLSDVQKYLGRHGYKYFYANQESCNVPLFQRSRFCEPKKLPMIGIYDEWHPSLAEWKGTIIVLYFDKTHHLKNYNLHYEKVDWVIF